MDFVIHLYAGELSKSNLNAHIQFQFTELIKKVVKFQVLILKHFIFVLIQAGHIQL